MSIDMKKQAQALGKLKLGALKDKYAEVIGEKPKSNNKPYMVRKILAAMELQAEAAAKAPASAPEAQEEAPKGGPAQEQAAGGTAAKGARAGKGKTRERDPRLPPAGEVLEREHDGKVIRVKVLEEGFQWRGKAYRSLSAIAKEATGTIWNGLLFFGIAKRKAEEQAAK
jgi:hypothetical protein